MADTNNPASAMPMVFTTNAVNPAVPTSLIFFPQNLSVPMIPTTTAPNPATPKPGFKPFEQDIPTEILGMIAANVTPENRLAFHLTCRSFKKAAFGPNNESLIPKYPISRATSVEAHIHAEANLSHPAGGPVFLICTVCAHLKGPDAFTRTQFNPVNATRFCIPCGIARGSYTGRHLDVQGKLRFPCKRCRRALPYSVKYRGEGVYKLCVGRYKYPKTCQLCKECFAHSVKELIGCTWNDLLLLRNMANMNAEH